MNQEKIMRVFLNINLIIQIDIKSMLVNGRMVHFMEKELYYIVIIIRNMKVIFKMVKDKVWVSFKMKILNIPANL